MIRFIIKNINTNRSKKSKIKVSLKKIIKFYLLFVSTICLCSIFSHSQELEETEINNLNQTLGTPQLTQEEIEWISDHPVLTATSKIDAAPMDFMRAGEHIGARHQRKLGF